MVTAARLYHHEDRQTFRAEYRKQIPLFIVANPFSKLVFLFRRTDFINVKIYKRYFGILGVMYYLSGGSNM